MSVCACSSVNYFIIFIIFMMEHSSVLTSLSTAQIGSFRFYIILLTLSLRSKTNLISNCVLYLNIPVSSNVVFLSFGVEMCFICLYSFHLTLTLIVFCLVVSTLFAVFLLSSSSAIILADNGSAKG